MNTRSQMRSLLLRMRCANTCSMSTATRGCSSSQSNSASCSSQTTRVPLVIATAEAVRGPPCGSNTGISPSTSPYAWMLSSCTRLSEDCLVSLTRPSSSRYMRWSVSPSRKMKSPLSYSACCRYGSSSRASSDETCLNSAVCSNVSRSSSKPPKPLIPLVPFGVTIDVPPFRRASAFSVVDIHANAR